MLASGSPRRSLAALLTILLAIIVGTAVGVTPWPLFAESTRDSLSRAVTAMEVSPSSGKLVTVSNDDGNIVLRRYTAEGPLDESFGSGGLVRSNFGGDDSAYAVALGPNDGVVVAGSTTWDGETSYLLAKYSSDGRLISNFGDHGKVVWATAPREAGATQVARAVAFQPDGKILMVGTTYYFGGPGFTWPGEGTVCCEEWSYGTVDRFNADGTPDTNFGTERPGYHLARGVVVRPYGEMTRGVELRAVAIDDDGHILVAGSGMEYVPHGTDFLILRLAPDGHEVARDWVDFGGEDGATAMALQTDGKIVLAGYAGGDFGVTRQMPHLGRDFSFGGPSNVQDATKRVAFGGSADRAEAVRIQPDGKIVLAGVTDAGRGDDTRFAVARLDANGWQDNSFDGDGKRTMAFEDLGDAFRFAHAFALAIWQDDELWGGGRVCTHGGGSGQCRPLIHRLE